MIPLALAFAAGVLSTCVGAAIGVWWFIRRAPRLEYDRDGEAQTLYVLPGQAHPVDEVNDYWRRVRRGENPAETYRPLSEVMERGPTTHYPPGTPPLIDTTATEDHDA